MHFLSTVFATAALAVSFVSALENPFTLPVGYTASVGRPVQLTWTPTSGSTVTIKLRQGNPGDLNNIETIVAHTENDGSYTWTPTSSIVYGTDYVLEIVNDQDTSEVNYSSYITVHSPNTVSSIISASSRSTYLGSSSTSVLSSHSSYSGSATATTTGHATYTPPPHANHTMTYPHGGNSTTTKKHSTTSKHTIHTTHRPTTTHLVHTSTSSTKGSAPTDDAAAPQQRNAVGMLALAIAGAVIVI